MKKASNINEKIGLGLPEVVQEVVEKHQESSSSVSGSRSHVVAKFIGMWLGSMVILVVIALMVNIEWVRPLLEDSLSSAFHREVRLGRLSWALGLNGLSVETNKFKISEKTGEPFILSGHSAIGIAFLPLFEKKLIIKHLEFEKPEVWAVKVAPNRWNFSDLLTEGPEIHMVQLEHGTLHLRNLSHDVKPPYTSQDWHAYDLKEIKLTLVVPRKDRVWPAYFACRIPVSDNKGGMTEAGIRLSATGKGIYEEWKSNKYSVELDLDKVNPKVFRPLITSLPDVDGILNVKFTADGVFNEGMTATTSYAVSSLKVPGGAQGVVEIPALQGKTSFKINPDSISWKDLELSMERWAFKSNGEILGWQKDSSQYEARIGGKLTDLRGLFTRLISKFLPPPKASEFAITKTEPGKMLGSAVVELKLSGDRKKHNVSTVIKATDVPLEQLLAASGAGNILSMLKLDPQAPISGEIAIDQSQRVELKNFTIPIDGSKLLLSGVFDNPKHETHLQFKADALTFDNIKKRLGQDSAFVKAAEPNEPSGRKLYTLEGTANLAGRFDTVGGRSKVLVQADIKEMKVHQPGTLDLATGVKGRLDYDGKTVKVHNLKGVLPTAGQDAAGDFELSGEISLESKHNFDFEVEGHRMDVAQLKNVLNICGAYPRSAFTDKVSGRVLELNAHLKSSKNGTTGTFFASPADVYIGVKSKSGNQTQQIHLNGGTISYIDNELAMKDVNFIGRNGKLFASAYFNGTLDKLALRSARVHSDGFELSELNFLFNKDLLPRSAFAAVPEFLVPTVGTGLRGRAYGDLQLNFTADVPDVNGVVGFYNAGGKFGRYGTVVDKLTGMVAVSRKKLILQDINGTVDKSVVSFDGIINDFQNTTRSWSGQLKGKFYPEELASLTEHLGHGIQMSASSDDPLSLRVSGTGEGSDCKLSFNGRADAGQGIALKTAFGTFTQPPDKALTFEGSLSLKQDAAGELILHNCFIHAGSDLIQAQGKFKWLSPDSEKPASLQFSMKTPDPIPAATLMQIIDADSQARVTAGTASVNMSVEGPLTDVVLQGSLSLDKVTVPALQIENLTGKIDIPHFNMSSQATSGKSEAKVSIATAKFGGAVFKDGTARLTFVDTPSPRIVLDSGEVHVSGGKLNLKGFVDWQRQRYHADIIVSKLIVDQLITDMIDHSGGVSGLADMHVTLDTGGRNKEEYIANLSGTGKFNIYQGSVASFGKLQEKLNGANLLQQGLFGFNVNNLLQTMLPVKTGQFREISGTMLMSQGIVHFDQVRFDGNDIRLRAAGAVNLPEQTMDLDIAGDIPRVTGSIIPGPFGEVSRNFTLQRLFRVLTFHKLKDLPALPLLGDLANDDPRSFSFKVVASMDVPKQISQSVEKSFHWLANKPFASAHPVPGM